MKNKKAYGERDCCMCGGLIKDGSTYAHIVINNKHHSVCSLCDSKLYYHYRDIIFDKIKHP